MKVEKLSSTAINTYLTCSARYLFRYVYEEVIPPTGALLLGTNVHRAIEYNMSQKIETHEDLPEADVLDYFSAVFDASKSEAVWYEDERPGDFKDTGIRVLKTHHQLVAPELMPLAVEKGFMLSLKSKPKTPDEEPIVYPTIEGWVDLINTEHKIIDNKTIGQTPKTPKPDHKLQTTIYTAGMRLSGMTDAKPRIIYLVKTKTPKVVQFDVPITVSDWAYFQAVLNSVVRGIENDVFIPNRNTWKCNRRWCGYWEMCEGMFHGTVPG